MYIIKTENKAKAARIKNLKFETEDEAKDHIDKFLQDDVAWVEEVEEYTVDLNKKVGQWMHIYSTKVNDFVSYGVLLKVSKHYAVFQTKENIKDFETSEITLRTISDMMDKKKAYFEHHGEFSDLKAVI